MGFNSGFKGLTQQRGPITVNKNTTPDKLTSGCSTVPWYT